MNLDEKISFIVCCPRSGSTWLRFLLNSHPEVACENETFVFTESAGLGNIFKAYSFELGFKGLNRHISKEDLITFTRNYLEAIFTKFLERKQKSFVIEKSVDHAFCIPLIRNIFPKAKFIHLIRDGRDVAVSLTEASKKWKAEYPNDLSEAFKTWGAYNSEIENNLNLIETKEKHFIKYEDLCRDTFFELKKLFDFIGCSKLSKEELENIVTANNFENLKNKYHSWGNGEFFRKGKANQWKLVLTEKEKENAKLEIGNILSRYEYIL